MKRTTKKISFIAALALTLCSLNLSAQEGLQSISIVKSAAGISSNMMKDMNKKVIDSSYMECRYELKYLKDTSVVITDSTRQQIVSKDMMLLHVGKKVAKFYSYNKFYTDSLLADAVKKQTVNGKGTVTFGNLKTKEGSPELIYKYPDGKLLYHCGLGPDSYQYEDNDLYFGWELLDETKELLGYTVHKATCDFRGRKYTAWYAPDISISNGPWKFSGLPGLILEISDSRDHYHYTAVGLKKTRDLPIYINEGNFIKIKRKKFQELKRRLDEDPISFLNNNSGGRVQIKIEGNCDFFKELKYEYQETDY